MRVEKDLKNKDLADVMGVTEAVIKNYMRGITPNTFRAITSTSSKYGFNFVEVIVPELTAKEPESHFRKAQAG